MGVPPHPGTLLPQSAPNQMLNRHSTSAHTAFCPWPAPMSEGKKGARTAVLGQKVLVGKAVQTCLGDDDLPRIAVK